MILQRTQQQKEFHMRQLILICGALFLVSIPCLAQTKPAQDAEEARMIADIERREAVIRDLIDTSEKCTDQRVKGGKTKD
jgi:hypothetical protein